MERHGVSLGLMSFFVKATIGALKAFPQLNAEIQGDEIILKHYYDIGIAVGAEEGLRTGASVQKDIHGDIGLAHRVVSSREPWPRKTARRPQGPFCHALPRGPERASGPTPRRGAGSCLQTATSSGDAVRGKSRMALHLHLTPSRALDYREVMHP